MSSFIRRCGIALVLAGGLLIVINVIISPSYLRFLEQGEAAFRTSGPYLIRLSVAVVDAVLLLIGCLGLHLAQRHVSGKVGAVAFAVSFLGTCLLIAIEWANVFVLRPLAQTSPESLEGLGDSALMTAGFASGAVLFMLGWLLMAASVWRSKVLPAWAAATTAAGLLAIPALGATPLGQNGQIVGNVIFGLGLAGMGRALMMTQERVEQKSP
jgi:hypothetical protein